MCGQPGGRRPSNPTLLLLVDHLDGLSERTTALGLHLAEDEPPPAPHDKVELVPTRPRVRVQDAIATQPVPPRGAALGGPAGRIHANTLGRKVARDRDKCVPISSADDE